MNYPTLNDRHFNKTLLVYKSENIEVKVNVFLSDLYFFYAERPYDFNHLKKKL